MASLAFAAGLDVVSSNISNPPSTKINGRPPSNDELDAVELPDYGGLMRSKSYNAAITPTGPQTPMEVHTPGLDQVPSPKTPNELERSQPPTPMRDEAASVVPSFWYPKMNRYRVLSACLEYFGNGMNDSAPGALIPYIESWYHIGYATVSLIWITNAAGFILAAFSTDFICTRLGRAKSLMLAEAILIASYVVIVCPVPFGVVVAAYLVLGFGEALNLALNNVFCSNLANSTVILGASHGSYGIGGIVGPILATALVSNGVHWSRFYLTTIGVRVICMASTGWSFWNYEKEGTTQFSNSLEQIASRQAAAEMGDLSKFRAIGRALKNRTTLTGALFIFAYQGAEVSESGWFISYLIDYRNGNPAHVGYVTSGFWAGITVGRFVLTHVARRVGEKKFVFGLGVGVITFQLLAWFVKDVISDAGESFLLSISRSTSLTSIESLLPSSVCYSDPYIRAPKLCSRDYYQPISKSSPWASSVAVARAEEQLYRFSLVW